MRKGCASLGKVSQKYDYVYVFEYSFTVFGVFHTLTILSGLWAAIRHNARALLSGITTAVGVIRQVDLGLMSCVSSRRRRRPEGTLPTTVLGQHLWWRMCHHGGVKGAVLCDGLPARNANPELDCLQRGGVGFVGERLSGAVISDARHARYQFAGTKPRKRAYWGSIGQTWSSASANDRSIPSLVSMRR